MEAQHLSPLHMNQSTCAHFVPGKSCVLPPLTMTTECSCKLCPSPGMYAMMALPVLSLTLATLRMAEFGFLGLTVYTLLQTPFFWYEPCKAGVLGCRRTGLRAPRVTWFSVALRDELVENDKRVAVDVDVDARDDDGAASFDNSDCRDADVLELAADTDSRDMQHVSVRRDAMAVMTVDDMNKSQSGRAARGSDCRQRLHHQMP